MRELALFAGAGGGILGSHLLGWKTVCAVEIEDYPRRVLLERQRDRILPRFPIWDDIATFDGRPWKGRVDIISGGFPCQDISVAGKRAGITGSRSGLWKEMRRVVCEVGPEFVFVENVPALLVRGFDVVLGDLAEMGYNVRWSVLGADDAGACHRRKRTWILAHTRQVGQQKIHNDGKICKKKNHKTKKLDMLCNPFLQFEKIVGKPGISGMDDGIPYRVDRLKAIGNGQVSAVAALAFIILSEGLI